MSIFSANGQSAIVAMIVACALPYIFVIIAKMAGGFKGYNNANPRAFLADLQGLPQRAHAAMQNSFESLPIFLAGIVLAMVNFVPQAPINTIAWLYVLLRVAFGVCYMLNLPTLRSIVWALSMACVLLPYVFVYRVLGL